MFFKNNSYKYSSCCCRTDLLVSIRMSSEPLSTPSHHVTMFGATFAATVNPVLITLALTFAAENNTKHTGHAEGAARLYPALGGSYILKRGDFD